MKKAGSINNAVMQILNLRLIYIFLFSAYLCFFFTIDLYTTSLGKAFLVGMSIFWMGRILEQFLFLRFNHWLNFVLTILFTAGMILFLLPVID